MLSLDDANLRFRIERLEALIMRALGGGSALTFAQSVVWRPGGVSGGNVYATWPEVVAAVAKLNGAVTIGVDTSIAAAVIPTGAWDLRPPGVNGPVEFVNATKGMAAPFVTVANAAVTIHGLSGLQDVAVENRSTSHLITVDAANKLSFYMRGLAQIYQSVLSGGAAFFRVTAGAIFDSFQLYMQDFTFLSTLDGGTNAVQMVGGANFISIQESASIDVNQLSRVAPGSCIIDNTGIAFNSAGFYPALGAQAGLPAPGAGVFYRGFLYRGQTTLMNGVSPVINSIVQGGTAIVVSVKTPIADVLTAKGYAALNADRVVGGPGGGSTGSFRIKALSAVGGGDVNAADQSVVNFEVVTS
jgi:hypothetical protein